MVKNSISDVDTLLDIKDDIHDRINILVYFKSWRWVFFWEDEYSMLNSIQ